MTEPVASSANNSAPVKAVTTSIATEELQHSTIIIQCQSTAGVRSSGTGFFFSFFKTPEQEVVAVVTNKHVISGAEKGLLRFTLMKPDGRADIGNTWNLIFEKDFAKAWIPHPEPDVDLAVLPLGPQLPLLHKEGKYPYIIASIAENIPTDDAFKELVPLEDILVVGYPDGISDARNNMPVFRRGITATAAYLDFEGRKEFLIDAAIFPGSSGSPAFIYNPGPWLNRKNELNLGSRLLLVGIVYGVAQHSVSGEIRIVPAPTQRQVAVSQIPNNLGICVRSSRILDFEPLFVKGGFSPPAGYIMRAK